MRRWLGVDHVYIVDNDSAPEYRIQPGLQDWVDSGFVTLHSMPGKQKQVRSYRLCDKLHRSQHNWMMYLDADEYLHIRDKYALKTLDCLACTLSMLVCGAVHHSCGFLTAIFILEQ